MALTQCPECGKTISDQATVCPTCGHPLQAQPAPAPAQPSAPVKASNRFKTGSIVGLIGGLGMVLLLAWGMFNSQQQSTSTDTQGPSVSISIGTVQETGLDDIALLAALFVTVVFIVALIAGNKLPRNARIAVAAVALVLSCVGLFGLLFYFNVLAICVMFLFLWQPVLEVIGSILMVSGAMKSDA